MAGSNRNFAARAALIAAVLCWAVSSVGCNVLSALSGGGSGGSGGGGGTTPPSAAIFVCTQDDPSCQAGTTFSLDAAKVFRASVQWSNVPAGDHMQKLQFIQPNGTVYRQYEDPFEVTSSNVGQATLTTTMNVVGTYIAIRQMTGDWQVQVLLDDKPIASQTVHVNP